MREGLRTLLDDVPNLKIIAEAENGQDAVALCHTHHPSIVLMDLSLPELDGIEAILQIHKGVPNTKILALTASATEVRAADAECRRSWLCSETQQQERAVASDGYRVSRQSVSGHSLERAASHCAHGRYRRKPPFCAHPAGKQVLKLIAEGDRNREIANKLTISLKTVETHRLNLMHKLDAHNAAKLTCRAYRLGVLDNDV